MSFQLPEPLQAAIHRGDPLTQLARKHGIPIDRLLAYVRVLRARPGMFTPQGQAAFLAAPRPQQLEMTMAYCLQRLQSAPDPADRRALDRLLLNTQHHIDRWHDPIARQQRERLESRRQNIRKECYIDDADFLEYQVERLAISYLVTSHEELKGEIIRCLNQARETLQTAS